MTQAQDKAAGRVLLPTYAAPTKYDLHVTPDLKAFVFDGIVKIDMTTTSEAAQHKTITLHAKELLFRSAQFQTAGGEAVVAEEVSIHNIFMSSVPPRSVPVLVGRHTKANKFCWTFDNALIPPLSFGNSLA